MSDKKQANKNPLNSHHISLINKKNTEKCAYSIVRSTTAAS